mgnify:FL=1
MPLTVPVASPWLAPFDGSLTREQLVTAPPEDAPGKKSCRKAREALVEELAELQHTLYADDRYSVLLVFQASDAAGKDGTIRAVLSGVNPAGVAVHPFKAPTPHELDHDYLWRTSKALPARGRIGVFNRSYYEEVLVVRVHPEYLGGQRLPRGIDALGADAFWDERMESIRDHEKHLARNGTIVLKFWLNVSADEQARRLLRRIDDPSRNWKFNSGDVTERDFRDAYQDAFVDAVNRTSAPHAPWYVIPADFKPYMRLQVADIVVRTLRGLDLRYPKLGGKERASLAAMRAKLVADLGEDPADG